MSRRRITKFIKDSNIEIVNRQNIAKVKEDVFEKIDTEAKAYWLGFMYADGSVGAKENDIQLTLKESDYEHLVKFKDFLHFKGEIRYQPKTKSYRISFRNKKMKQDLIKCGCVPQKSKILTFPSYDIVPKDLIIHFIRGYIEGDGYIGIANNKYPRLNILGTEDVIMGIINELQLKIPRVRKANKNGAKEVKQVEWKGKYLIDIYKKLYSNSTVFLNRKYDIYKKIVVLPT